MITAKFIEPMLLKSTEQLPAGDQWAYELFLRVSWSSGAVVSIKTWAEGIGCGSYVASLPAEHDHPERKNYHR
jgi:hypothetical protein